jgi:hypothetical protein
MVRRRDRHYQEALMYHKRKSSFNSFLFVIYVLFGVYLLNVKLNFFKIPEFILGFNDWIILVGGVLLIFSSMGFLRKK